MEIVTGIGAIALGLAFWGAGWWHWLLIGVGASGLLPWFGAAAILRRAARRPEILISDPDRRRQRGRRAMAIIGACYTLAGALIGYVLGGWGMAAFVAVIVGLGTALGAWWYLSGERTEVTSDKP